MKLILTDKTFLKPFNKNKYKLIRFFKTYFNIHILKRFYGISMFMKQTLRVFHTFLTIVQTSSNDRWLNLNELKNFCSCSLKTHNFVCELKLNSSLLSWHISSCHYVGHVTKHTHVQNKLRLIWMPTVYRIISLINVDSETVKLLFNSRLC